MKKHYQRVRHINAKPDEWVKVHRPAAFDWDSFLTKAVCWIVGIVVALKIIGFFLPWIFLAWVASKFVK